MALYVTATISTEITEDGIEITVLLVRDDT